MRHVSLLLEWTYKKCFTGWKPTSSEIVKLFVKVICFYVVEIVASQLFQGLRMDVQDINQCAADFVCLRDIEVLR